MALTVSESSAVFDLLHWLGVHPLRPSEDQLVEDERAAAALALLADHAGKTLQIHVQPGEAREAIERLAGRLAGADSDGAAQTVCRAIAEHLRHGGALPWPSIRRPFDDWAQAHDAAAARPGPAMLDRQLDPLEEHG